MAHLEDLITSRCALVTDNMIGRLVCWVPTPRGESKGVVSVFCDHAYIRRLLQQGGEVTSKFRAPDLKLHVPKHIPIHQTLKKKVSKAACKKWVWRQQRWTHQVSCAPSGNKILPTDMALALLSLFPLVSYNCIYSLVTGSMVFLMDRNAQSKGHS